VVVESPDKKGESKAPPAGPPLFQDITKESGIDFTYQNGEDDVVFAIIESLGGGVGVVDYDNDGWMDLFFPAGGYYEGKKIIGNQPRLYRNLGNLKFADVSKEVGLDKVKWCYSHGVSVTDYDRDGHPDLLVTGYARLHLLHNEAGPDGKRVFVEVTEKAKLDDRLWSSSSAWGDLDGDGFPDLYICHYGNWGFDAPNVHPTDCSYGLGQKRDVCQPGRFKPLPHSLYKNNGDGTFTDLSSLLKPEKGGRGIGVVMVDVNQDQKPDVYTANDTDDNYLFINRSRKGEFTLEEKGFPSSSSRDDEGKANGSMGVDAASFDRSGKPAIIVTNYENELPALYLNRCTPLQALFSFGTHSTGLSVVGGNYVSWGTGFFDVENRGWEDLYIVSGHAIRYPLDKFGRLQKPLLMKNQEGKFIVNTPSGGEYFQDRHNARGSAVVDLDNDGKLDLIISHLNAPVRIQHNIAPGKNHWFGLRLKGKQNRDLVGSRVSITVDGKTQYRFIKSGGSYASSQDPRLHFGLGEATKIDLLTIEWAGGERLELPNMKADAYLILEEP
jgi:hypothetical protein